MIETVQKFRHLISERLGTPHSYRAVPTIPLAELCPDSERNGSVGATGDEIILSTKKVVISFFDGGVVSSLDWWRTRALWALLYTFRSLRAAFIYTIPSFIQNLWAEEDLTPPRKVPPTAYLNGLRGLAAFSVFTQHYTTDYYAGEHHWGYHARSSDTWTSELPVLRFIHCGGGFAVPIFYVLSGYVLAYKPLQYVRQGDEGALMKNMTSAIFRRALRLFLPLLPPLLLSAFLVSRGSFGHWKHMRSRKSVDGTFWSELWFTIRVYERLANPFPLNGLHPPTIPALYTIPVEFRGSITVFTMVIGLAKVTPTYRMIIFAIISVIALCHARWDSFVFMNGVILAELRYTRNESTLQLQEFFKNFQLLRLVKFLRVVFWTFILLLSLFLGSWPISGGRKTPGYVTLATWTPPTFSGNEAQFFWRSIAAVLLLYTLENLECLQRPFASAFMQYMGDISFSLYVLHFPVMLTIGRWITIPLIQATSKPLGLAIGGFLITPVLICASDLQWRACDMSSVRFAKWLERRLFIPA